jgi:hypothetical protein
MPSVASEKKSAKQEKSGPSAASSSLVGFLNDADRRLHSLAAKAETNADTSRVKLHLGLMELESVWERSKRKLEREIATVRRLGTEARGVVDETKVKAHLAAADARVAAKDAKAKLASIEQRLRFFAQASETEVQDLVKRLGGVFADLRKSLANDASVGSERVQRARGKESAKEQESRA